MPLLASALARSTAPGLGYGRCWKRGPAAVVSAPVLASLRLGSPVDHVPLFWGGGGGVVCVPPPLQAPPLR